MTWMKVDDTLHGHPKARAAGLPAMGLWVMAGSWCMAYPRPEPHTGFVPAWYVASFPSGRKHADALVRAGLWVAVDDPSEPGWQFHDWLDYQPTKDDIDATRERARDRQRASRARRREDMANKADRRTSATRDRRA